MWKDEVMTFPPCSCLAEDTNIYGFSSSIWTHKTQTLQIYWATTLAAFVSFIYGTVNGYLWFISEKNLSKYTRRRNSCLVYLTQSSPGDIACEYWNCVELWCSLSNFNLETQKSNVCFKNLYYSSCQHLQWKSTFLSHNCLMLISTHCYNLHYQFGRTQSIRSCTLKHVMWVAASYQTTV